MYGRILFAKKEKRGLAKSPRFLWLLIGNGLKEAFVTKTFEEGLLGIFRKCSEKEAPDEM